MKIKIEVPETLSDITLDQYQRYLKAIDGEHTEDFIKQKTIEVSLRAKSTVLFLIYLQ